MKFITFSLSILLLSLSSFSVAETKKGIKEVILENDSVEVVRLTYPAGTESGMHQHKHPNRVVYVVKGGRLELTPADPHAAPKILAILAGKALFLPATKHNVKNIGVSEIILIETEIKAQVAIKNP
jgi:quercetin dioxygenase-like cupin family protein